MRSLVAAWLMLLLALGSACSSDDAADQADDAAPAPTTSSSTAPPEPSVTPDARYATATELKDALVEAGYQCRRWREDNAVRTAASSGICSDADTLMVFATDADLNEQVDIYQEFDGLGPYLIGPNWIVNAPDADQYVDELGGTVLR